MSEIIVAILQVCLIPLLGALTGFLVKYINAKSDQLKARAKTEKGKEYITRITDTVITCVLATKQTYVDTLKAQGSFDQEAQKVAFERTYAAIQDLLTDELKNYLSSITGDATNYLSQMIESQVSLNK